MTTTSTKFRKMGAAEIVYDYELGFGNMILPITLVFDCGVDLFAHTPRINAAIRKWKSEHPILGARIVAEPDSLHKSFSNERYFAKASEDKMNSLSNVRYLKLVLNESTTTTSSNINYTRYVDMLNEHELNAPTVDAQNGPLWRLLVVELSRSRTYAIVFTAHHAIMDAKNGYTVINQLLELIDASLNDLLENITTATSQVVGPSIEDKLFGNDPTALANIKINEKFDISPECKIPNEFGNDKQFRPRLTNINETDRFEFLADENNNKDPAWLINDLITASSNRAFRFTSFVVDEEPLKKLLAKCKQANSKLTGCLNVIASLPIYELLKRYKSKSDLTSEKICFHLLANLRPFLNLGELNMGYWAVVMNSIINCEGVSLDADTFSRRFWELAKLESDSIHARIDSGELFENAKMDTILLELINKETKFDNGGGVHFAISNLGNLQFKKLSHSIAQREVYFCTSLTKYRWSSLIFHGLSSIDNRLCWGIGYVTEFVSDAIIDEYIKLIQHIIKSVV